MGVVGTEKTARAWLGKHLRTDSHGWGQQACRVNQPEWVPGGSWGRRPSSRHVLKPPPACASLLSQGPDSDPSEVMSRSCQGQHCCQLRCPRHPFPTSSWGEGSMRTSLGTLLSPQICCPLSKGLEVWRSRSFRLQVHVQLQSSLFTSEGQKLGTNMKS